MIWVAGTVREISCPSDGEEQAALYNMACAYAQLRQTESALTCLEAVLETGFEDMQGLRSDPDLQPCHGAQFESLMSKCAQRKCSLSWSFNPVAVHSQHHQSKLSLAIEANCFRG